MYPFLNNFHERMELVSIHHFLSEKTAIKANLKKSDFSSEEATNLMFELLSFIMEKSLLEQSCTFKDMSAFLRYLIKFQYEKEIEEEDLVILVKYLVRDSLQNGGKAYYFNTYNFKENKPIAIYIRLIEDKRILSDEGEVFSYNMTTQGYRFMFSTLEVEESLQISLEQMKLMHAIKRRNFGSAKESVDSLFNMNRMQIQKIKQYIRQIKEDIGLFSNAAYEATYLTTFETLKDQKDKHEELYQLIQSTRESYLTIKIDKNPEAILEDLKTMDYIKDKLQKLLGEQMSLFATQQSLSEVYDEAIGNVLYIGFENRMSLEKDLLEPFEKGRVGLDAIGRFLRPLFRVNPQLWFNPNLAYAPQRIETFIQESEVNERIMEAETDETLQAAIKEEIQKTQGSFEAILEQILIHVNDSGIALLSELFTEAADIVCLRKCLMQLYADHCIPFEGLMAKRLEIAFQPTHDFDFAYTYTCLVEKNPERLKLKQLITRIDKEQIIKIKESETGKELICYEMIFSVK